jgi:hypothetical protein
VSVIGPTIEVKTIDERHRRSGLLKEFGIKIILRLAIDPVRQPPGVVKRAITVNRISPGSGEERWEETRELGWAGLPEYLDECEQIPIILNEHLITEQAAIGVMLLLIHELEGAILPTVLPIGSGGDYLVSLRGASKPVQVEVSGIKSGSAGQASSRLGVKRGQVRGAGFASVTTFQYGEAEAAHSYLHSSPRAAGPRAGRVSGNERP